MHGLSLPPNKSSSVVSELSAAGLSSLHQPDPEAAEDVASYASEVWSDTLQLVRCSSYREIQFEPLYRLCTFVILRVEDSKRLVWGIQPALLSAP